MSRGMRPRTCDNLLSVRLILLLIPITLLAQDHPLASLPYTPSLENRFLDRAADPCVDFYQFSCGNWNKLNPIPPDQARWDVYAKLTDDNQRYLWGILDEAAKTTAGRTPLQQKIGDYFFACMDEAAVERAGVRPLQPRLDEIAALKSAADLPAVLARMHLESGETGALFAFGSSQDFADSSRVIAFASSGGLGLPDRDYYVNSDTKSQDIRAKYLDHIAAMLALLGDSPDSRARRCADSHGHRNRPGQSHTHPRRPARPIQTLPQIHARTTRGAHSHLRLGLLLGGLSLPVPASFNVTEPDFYKEVEHQLKTAIHPGVEDLSALAPGARPRRRTCPQPFVETNFNFYSKTLRGVDGNAAALEALRQLRGPRSGRSARPGVRGQEFHPRDARRDVAMTKEIETAMEGEIAAICPG